MSDEIKLRPYQLSAVEDTIGEVVFGDTANVVIEAPTGSGKSIIIAALCKELDDQRITIIVNITELIDQIAEHLDLLGLDYSILKAGREHQFDANHRIQLVMAQTLYARLDKVDFNCDIMIQDEYHREYSTQRTSKILNKLQPNSRIGLSATPFDNEGFLLHGATMVGTTTVDNLEKQGFLSPIKYLVPKWSEMLDYSVVSKTGSDYNTEKLDTVVNTSEHIARSIESMNYIDAKNKKCIIFCSTIAQCENITQAMKVDGFLVESVHSKKKSKVNDAILDAFKHNKGYKEPRDEDSTDPTLFDEEQAKMEYPHIKCLVSVAKLSTGFDVKDIDLGILMRPTMVRSLFIQMVGRNTRISNSLNSLLEKHNLI